jgi:hypothetical protein
MSSQDTFLGNQISIQDRLKDLMMDLLSTTIEVDQRRLDNLTPKDWEVLNKFIRDHRIGPMLYWGIRASRKNLSFPPTFFDAIKNRYRANTFTNLAAERELIMVSEAFNKAMIPFVALKGAFLAWHVYPEKGLRPLRDLDLLVPKERALEAFDCLIKAGARRMKGDNSDPALMLEHPGAHHLPPILSSHGTLGIEIHWLLFHHHKSDIDAWDLAHDKNLWKRCITLKVNQTEVPFLSPTDQLVHLIEHAFLGHELDNGPLVLTDIAFLIQQHEIDWPLFDQLIKEGELKQAARLALAIVYRDYKIGSIDWLMKHHAEPSLIEATIINARRLMLRDYGERKHTSLSTDVFGPMTILEKIKWVVKLICAPKIKVALEFNLDQKSTFLWCYYPIRWARQVFIEIPRILLARMRNSSSQESFQINTLRAWLKKESR